MKSDFYYHYTQPSSAGGKKVRIRMFKFFKRFTEATGGATAIEYALIAALISVGIITAATTFGDKLDAKIESISKARTGK